MSLGAVDDPAGIGAHTHRPGRGFRPTVSDVSEFSDEIVEFLSSGTRTGMLGYVASDGRPLVAPVWFIVDGQELVFNTDKHTAKGRALTRDPRVVICVDDPHPPYSFVRSGGWDTCPRIGDLPIGNLSAEPAALSWISAVIHVGGPDV